MGKDLEEGNQDIVVQFAKKVIELDRSLGEAIHVNLNIAELVKELPTLPGGVTSNDGGIFPGMLDGRSRDDGHEVEPGVPVVQHDDGLAAESQYSVHLGDRLLRIDRVVKHPMGVNDVERSVGKVERLCVAYTNIARVPLPTQVGLGQLDGVLGEIDGAHLRPGPGKLKEIDAYAASYFENLLPLVSRELDIVTEIVDLLVAIFLQGVEELGCPDGEIGNLDIVDELVPVVVNVFECRICSHEKARSLAKSHVQGNLTRNPAERNPLVAPLKKL
jgi:hypothetical protein